MAVPDDPSVMLPRLRFTAAKGGEIFTPEVVRRNSRACNRKGRNKGRFWVAFTLTIGLALLLTWAVAAQGAKSTAAVRLAPLVISTDRTQLRSNQRNAVSSGHASGIPFTTYLPAVFRGYGGCSTKPTLISPANGSNLSTLAPLYVWDDGSNPAATAFRLQVARDAAFSQSAGSLRAGIHGEYQFRFSINLDPSTTYYWRAYLICGSIQGPYSDVWAFTTGSGGTVLPAPALVAPANGTGVPATTVTLQWSSVSGAVEYLVRWRTPDEGGHTNSWLNDTQMTESFASGTTYEWWVSARNDYAIGADSEKWKFTTPVEPSLVSTQDLNRSLVVEDSSGTIVFEAQGSK